MTPAEEWVLSAALERGFLTPARLEEARRLAAERPHPAGLLGHLRQGFLGPEQVQALQRAWQDRSQPGPPAPVATFAVPPLAPPPPPPPTAPAGGAPPGDPPVDVLGATLPLPPPQGTQAGPATPAPPASWSPAQAAAETLAPSGGPGASGPGSGRVGPFEVIRELARGGMGVVYVARRPGLDRHVALKQMLSQDGPPHPAHVQRFLDEARLAARLQHPHIVRVLEVGEQDGLPWFAMDLIEGQSLDARIARQGPLPPREAAALFAKLARALAYAHGQRLLHRDLKPANVLLTPAGEPVLTDFGLVKALDEGGTRLTQQGDLMGTPAYMPPEQAEGQHDRIDQRADVYSLGATLYEALTGSMPFQGKTPIAVLHAVLTQDAPPPSRLVRGLDRDLETIVLRCLEKDPLRRYPGASALAEDLERWLRDEPIAARRATTGELLARWVRRNRALAAVGAGLLACVFLGAPAAAAWVLHTRSQAAAQVEAERARERERLAGEARGEAGRALAGLAVPGTAGLTARAREEAMDQALGRALQASRAAEQWRALTPEDPAARETAHRAASLLAEIAAAGQQWAVARQAWEQALAAGIAPAETRRRLERLDADRRAEAERRRAEVEAILREVQGGQLTLEVDGLRGAVMRLVRYTEPELVQLLCDRLRALADELRAAERELYEEARHPTPEEARAGAEALPSLVGALERRAAGAELEAGQAAALRTAEERLLARARRQRVEARDAAALVARAQVARVGATGRDLARVLCESLGWIGDPRAVEALRRYLLAESEEGCAAPAALALGQLGGEEAQAAVRAALRRFPPGGPLTSVVEGLVRSGGDERADAVLLAGLDAVAIHEARHDLPAVEAALDRRLTRRPQDTSARAMRAQIRALRGNLGGAREDAEAARDQTPPDGVVWLHLARTYAAIGEEELARRCIVSATDLAPHLGEAWVVRADLAKEQDPGAALADVDRALAQDPRLESARALRALVLGRLGRYEDALIEANELEGLAPRSHAAWAARAHVHLLQGELEAARREADRAVDLDPRHPNPREVRMEVRAGLGDLPGALEDAEAALATRPGNFVVLNNSAEILERLGRLEEAEARYGRCLEILPRAALVLNNRGNVRRKLGRLDEARADLEQALQWGEREKPTALVNLALVLVAQGDLPGATARMKEAVAIPPEDPAILSAWARFLFEHVRGPPQETLAAAERGLRLAPEDPMLRFVRGMASYLLGRREQALADLDRVVQLDPQMALAWSNRGHIRREGGDLTGARADFDQALTIEPEMTLAWGNRADLRRETGDLAGALADVDQVLRLLPGDPELRSHRAGTLLLMGRRDEALNGFRELASRDPWAAVWAALLAGQPELLEPHRTAAGWEGWIVRAALGATGAEALLLEAEAAQDEATRAARRCEARWVLGLLADQAGDEAAARTHWEAAIGSGNPRMIERQWAARRLGR